MDTPTADFMPRRNFLALSTLGSGLATLGATALAGASQASAAVPGSDSLLDVYARVDSRPDGKPVFWLTRGREYIVKDGLLTPLYDRHIILATHLIRQPDGGFKKPYTESAFSTMPDTTDVPKMLTSPINGAAYPNPFMHQVRLTLTVSPTGQITQKVDLDKAKIHSLYKGRITFVNSPEGNPLVACEINARAVTPTEVIDLTELGPYLPQGGQTADGFTPAMREVIVLRKAPPAITGEAAATQIGIHPSKKFASLTELAKVLTPQETENFGPWLQNWEKLLYDPSDVVLG
jgi:hypothetical protein